MAKQIQAVRGMNDILPEQTPYWARLEALCRRVLNQYAYQEIRFPIVESTALFERSIGEATDIVEKEMYTFLDRNGDSLTLRPEGTASCVRAGLEHGLFYNQLQRLWYIGPMFRHERPQKGRYRQFHQLGVEAYGMAGAECDVEVILLSARLLKELGLSDKVRLEINTLGSLAVRETYRRELVAYLNTCRDALDEDSTRRLVTNPLRILDSKNPAMQTVIAGAPQLINYLDAESKAHFEKLTELLSAAGLKYVLNPRLVRGLDYYCHTVFEWVTNELGAQGTVCAGGRYDGLVEQLGGKPTPAFGFASGLERLVLLLAQQEQHQPKLDVYLILGGKELLSAGLNLAEQLRDQLPTLTIETDLTCGGFKNQFKRADKSGAKLALVLGGDEWAAREVTVKDLRSGEQQRKRVDELVEFLRNNV